MSYEKYFKDVSGYDVIDVYRVHRLFGVNDEALCHASKKLLRSGAGTGGKTLEQDVREARDTLNRWLEMLAEDLGNAQEKDGQNGNDGAVYSEYTLEEVIGDAVLSDWARWVAVDEDGDVWEFSGAPYTYDHGWVDRVSEHGSRCGSINKVVRPLNFKNCIWEIK